MCLLGNTTAMAGHLCGPLAEQGSGTAAVAAALDSDGDSLPDSGFQSHCHVCAHLSGIAGFTAVPQLVFMRLSISSILAGGDVTFTDSPLSTPYEPPR
jgi:hypothetical protein